MLIAISDKEVVGESDAWLWPDVVSGDDDVLELAPKKSIAQIAAEAIVNDQLAPAGLDLAAATPEARSEAARKSWLTRKRNKADDEKVEPPKRPPVEITPEQLNNMFRAGLPSVNSSSDVMFYDGNNRKAAKVENSKRLVLKSGGKLTADEAAGIADKWAATSADSAKAALLLQKKAHDLYETGDLDTTLAMRLEAARDQGVSLGYKHGSLVDDAVLSKKHESFLRATYKNTQEWFAKSGFGPDDEIVLYRGTSRHGVGFIYEGDTLKIRANPLTSWSFDPEAAKDFAGNTHDGMVLRRKAKVKEIISSARTGLGCLGEREFVLLGQYGKDAIVDWVKP